MRQKIGTVLESLHRRIFAQEMSDTMREFLKGLGFSTGSTIIGGLILFVFNTAVARRLEVAEYGNFQLVQSLAIAFSIPMVMGLSTAAVHYMQLKEDKKQIVGTSMLTVGLFSLITSVLAYIFSRPLSDLLSIPIEIFSLAVIYSAVFSIYTIARSILQGYKQFARMALYDIAYAVMVIGSFIAMLLIGETGVMVPVYSLLLGTAVYAGLVIYQVRSSLSSFNIPLLKLLLTFGGITVLASVAGYIVGHYDKLVINKLLSPESLGMYVAYLYPVGVIQSIFMQLFITVFFPFASQTGDEAKSELRSKMKRLFLLFSPALLIVAGAFIVFTLILFGSKYGLDPKLVAVFALYSVLQMYIQSQQWLLLTFKGRGVAYSTMTTVIVSGISLVSLTIAAKQYGLIGVALALLINTTLFIFINGLFFNKAVALAKTS